MVGSLDDILASVLDEPVSKPPAKPPTESSLDDLDLDLPDEPPAHPKLELDFLEEDILGTKEKPAEEPHGVTFECPGCGSRVDEHATRCPSCGALFAEGETFSCPVCGTTVPLDSAVCPECGVRFEDEKPAISQPAPEVTPPRSFVTAARRPTSAVAPPPGQTGAVVQTVMDHYAQRRGDNPFIGGDTRSLAVSLQEQVGTIKSLVTMANRLRVPVDNTQRAIAAATQKARARDLVSAVRLAWEARMTLEQSLALQVAQRLEALQEDLNARRAKGEGFPVAEALIRDGILEVQGGRLGNGFEKLQMAKEDLSAGTSGQSEAHYALQNAEQFVKDVGELGADVNEYRALLTQSREALRRGDWEMATQRATDAEQRARDGLQRGIAEEMRRARQVVMELKVRGQEVSQLIAILKQASASAKEKGYEDALRYLQMFKQQVRSIG